MTWLFVLAVERQIDIRELAPFWPMTLAMVSEDGSINVKSIRSDQFAQVPGLSNPDQVTLQEEDRITAFYGGGHLCALPMRWEGLIWV